MSQLELAIDAQQIADPPPQVLEQVLAPPPGAALRSKEWNDVLAEGRKFEAEMRKLAEGDRGKLASLKRSVGETLGSARGVAWFHGRLWGARQRNAEKYFLLATLFDWNRKRAPGGDMGTTMRLLAQSTGFEAVERRFLVLLDADFDSFHDAQDGFTRGGGELAFRLRQAVKLAASKEVGVHWPLLLADLCLWNAPNKPVQKKWARNFYAPNLTTNDSPAPSTSNASASATSTTQGEIPNAD